eukprot:1195667-Prorocentrum_minimum.AAC.6
MWRSTEYSTDCILGGRAAYEGLNGHVQPFPPAREYFGGELNFPVVERLEKSLTTAWNPT